MIVEVAEVMALVATIVDHLLPSPVKCSGGPGDPKYPACLGAGPLWWERGPLRRSGGGVKGVGEGEGGAYPASRGIEAGPREIDGPAAEAGGGAGGTHG